MKGPPETRSPAGADHSDRADSNSSAPSPKTLRQNIENDSSGQFGLPAPNGRQRAAYQLREASGLDPELLATIPDAKWMSRSVSVGFGAMAVPSSVLSEKATEPLRTRAPGGAQTVQAPAGQRDMVATRLPRPKQGSPSENPQTWESGTHTAGHLTEGLRAQKHLSAAHGHLYAEFEKSRRPGHVRRRSDFRPPPRNRFDKEFCSAVMFALRRIDAATWAMRKRGEHRGIIGSSAIELMRVLLFDVHKGPDGRLFPSLKLLAKLCRMSKQTVVDAKARLEQMGFLTTHRRSKRIETPWGIRVVQDSNAYQVHLPTSGLGALAMALFCKPGVGEAKAATSPGTSESRIWSVIDSIKQDRDRSNRGSKGSGFAMDPAGQWWLE